MSSATGDAPHDRLEHRRGDVHRRDQDAALAFYTEKLGWEVRDDTRYGENNEGRWLEVAPPGSRARLALNPPMGDEPGGASIGVGTADVRGEHARLSTISGIDLDPEPMRPPGAPPMFGLRVPTAIDLRGGGADRRIAQTAVDEEGGDDDRAPDRHPRRVADGARRAGEARGRAR